MSSSPTTITLSTFDCLHL
uniref:Uncharacterized protein n=1 Tax=Arundo donax TaxID=35708 RepID=A0A0A9CF37_ARUDO